MQIGYAAFGDDTKDIITLNLPADWSTTLVKVGSLRKRGGFASDGHEDVCFLADPCRSFFVLPGYHTKEEAGNQLLRAGIGSKNNLMTADSRNGYWTFLAVMNDAASADFAVFRSVPDLSHHDGEPRVSHQNLLAACQSIPGFDPAHLPDPAVCAHTITCCAQAAASPV